MISSLCSSATRLAVSSTTYPTSRRSCFLACFASHSFHNQKIPSRHLMMSSMGGEDSPQNSNNKKPPPPIPRAAVSVCVRCTVSTNKDPYYLLIQRGKEPNKGMWSLPGGSIEFGEDAVDAGRRELAEETVWEASVKGANNSNNKQKEDQDVFSELQWYRGTIATTDAIGQGYHYLIAHCFAELILVQEEPSTAADCGLPRIQPADDADDASWLTARQIRDLEQSSNPNRHLTPGVVRVIQRVEELSEANLLPTSKQIL